MLGITPVNESCSANSWAGALRRKAGERHDLVFLRDEGAGVRPPEGMPARFLGHFGAPLVAIGQALLVVKTRRKSPTGMAEIRQREPVHGGSFRQILSTSTTLAHFW